MHGIVTLAARLMTQTIACASGAGGVAAVKRIDQGAGAGDTPCYRWPEDELVEGRGCGVYSELQFDNSGLGTVVYKSYTYARGGMGARIRLTGARIRTHARAYLPQSSGAWRCSACARLGWGSPGSVCTQQFSRTAAFCCADVTFESCFLLMSVALRLISCACVAAAKRKLAEGAYGAYSA